MQPTPNLPPPTLEPLVDLSWVGEVFFLFLAVGLLLWVGFRLLGRPPGNGVMKVLAKIPLEARRSLYLVEVTGSYFLIGAGEGGLSTLAELEASQVKEALASAQKNEKPLAVQMMELLQKKRANKDERA